MCCNQSPENRVLGGQSVLAYLMQLRRRPSLCGFVANSILKPLACKLQIRTAAMSEVDGEPSWMTVSKRKRELQQAAITTFRSLEALSNAHTITDIDDASELAALIARGEYTALDVTMAYIQR